MKIEKIELYLTRRPMIRPWKTAYGEDRTNDILLVRMCSGSFEGWGEASPLPGPTFGPEYGKGTYEVARRFLAPMLIDKTIDTAEELNRILNGIKGNSFAKAALETAWWALKADMEQVPLRRLFGVEGRPEIELMGCFGIEDTIDTLIEKLDACIKTKPKTIKLKAMHGWDLEMLTAVRSTFPDQSFHIDCNSSYAIDELDTFKKIDKLHLAMIEQPFAAHCIYDHACLAAAIDTPVCLDESITDIDTAREAIALKACGYINIKPGRIGGFYNSLIINQLCAEAGVGNWIGGMIEDDIGMAPCIELAALPNMTYPMDQDVETGFYGISIAETPLVFEKPWILPTSDRCGSPIVPNMERMLSFVSEKTIF